MPWAQILGCMQSSLERQTFSYILDLYLNEIIIDASLTGWGTLWCPRDTVGMSIHRQHCDGQIYNSRGCMKGPGLIHKALLDQTVPGICWEELLSGELPQKLQTFKCLFPVCIHITSRNSKVTSKFVAYRHNEVWTSLSVHLSIFSPIFNAVKS